MKKDLNSKISLYAQLLNISDKTSKSKFLLNEFEDQLKFLDDKSLKLLYFSTSLGNSLFSNFFKPLSDKLNILAVLE